VTYRRFMLLVFVFAFGFGTSAALSRTRVSATAIEKVAVSGPNFNRTLRVYRTTPPGREALTPAEVRSDSWVLFVETRDGLWKYEAVPTAD
jgi:hypothetical protein